MSQLIGHLTNQKILQKCDNVMEENPFISILIVSVSMSHRIITLGLKRKHHHKILFICAKNYISSDNYASIYFWNQFLQLNIVMVRCLNIIKESVQNMVVGMVERVKIPIKHWKLTPLGFCCCFVICLFVYFIFPDGTI